MKRTKRCPRGCVPVSGGLGAVRHPGPSVPSWDQPKEWVVLDTRSGTTKRVWFETREAADAWNRANNAGFVQRFNALKNDFEDVSGLGGGRDSFSDPKVLWLNAYEGELRKLLAGREFPKHNNHLPYGHMVALKMTPREAAKSYLRQTRYGKGVPGLRGISDGTPLDDFEARDLLYQWHGGQGSGVYQVASMMDHGVPEGAYERARGELAAVRVHEQQRKASGQRMSGGPEAIEELDALITWLDGKIGGTAGLGGLGHDDEPDEDDITTGDHHRWYQSGKLYFTGDEAGLRAKMEQDKFWPNVWFISDHGNSHLITV